MQPLCIRRQVRSQRAPRQNVECSGMSTAVEEMVKWDLHAPASRRDALLGYAELALLELLANSLR